MNWAFVVSSHKDKGVWVALYETKWRYEIAHEFACVVFNAVCSPRLLFRWIPWIPGSYRFSNWLLNITDPHQHGKLLLEIPIEEWQAAYIRPDMFDYHWPEEDWDKELHPEYLAELEANRAAENFVEVERRMQ